MEGKNHDMSMTSGEFRAMRVTSPWFDHEQMIPVKFTCEGEDVNPPLDIDGIPDKARSLALVVEDPDAPAGTWLHWSVWNIPITQHLKEDEIPGVQGKNDFGRNDYGGPCPPSGTHRYYFKLYALDDLISLRAGASIRSLRAAMEGHILAYGELMGTYKKGVHEKHTLSR